MLDFSKDKNESDFMHEFSKDAYKVMVAGHELFGHGSGKLIYKDEKTGKCPISYPDPLNTSNLINTCYEKGDSYTPMFGDISSSYEECRADLSGLWLSAFPEAYSIFSW